MAPLCRQIEGKRVIVADTCRYGFLYTLTYVGNLSQKHFEVIKILTLLTFRCMARPYTLLQCDVEIQAQFHCNLINVFTHRVPYTLIHSVQ